MRVRTGPKQRDTGAGFTLVELLLAVALLVLLLGAMVYNFSGLQQNAQLDEGAQQMETLLRFASAQAANSGRQVQLSFEESVGDGVSAPLRNLRLLWEADPVARPGIFEPLGESQEYVQGLNDLIRIDSVHLLGSSDSEWTNASERLEEGANSTSTFAIFPAIGFFPDGSSDSAEIILASRSEEDSRRISLRLQGIIGSIRRKLVADELKAAQTESQLENGATGSPTNVKL